MKSFVLFMIFTVIVECVSIPAIVSCVKYTLKTHSTFMWVNIVLSVAFFLCIQSLLVLKGILLWMKVGV